MRQERFFLRPLFQQLRDAFAERIASGEWKPGDVLPNEIELAREFGVSPGTARKSLDLLESERLVTRRQGRGTFVNDPGSQHLAHRFDNLHLTNGTRVGGEAKTLNIVCTEASALERLRLELIAGDLVYRATRIRSHLGDTFMIEEACFPAALFPGLVEKALPSHRLVEVAHAYGVLLGNAEERVSVESPSLPAVHALKLGPETPVLFLDRVIRTRGGRPAEWRKAECSLKRMYYQAELA